MIPDIIYFNLKEDYRILQVFGRNIFDTASQQIAVEVFTSPSICSCSTWGNQNKQHITFLFKVIWLFN